MGRGISDELTSPVDIWATVAELTDISPPPRGTDSVSFAGILRDPSASSARRYVYSQHVERAVRTLTHKLRQDAAGKLELYDLVSDPFEIRPIDPGEHPDQELVTNLRYWLENPGSGRVTDRR